MSNRVVRIITGWLSLLLIPGFHAAAQPTADSATVRIRIMHRAQGRALIPGDTLYVNPFGEPYQIQKLKYYLTGFRLNNQPVALPGDRYLLVDLHQPEIGFQAVMPAGHYRQLTFSLGVDSADNCSGAQSGALDPMNNMFWTWNSGYVFFKLEGYSDRSPSDLNRIEHHIGGYRAGQSVRRKITLPIPVNEGSQALKLMLTLDLDRYWKSKQEIRIANHPLCMSPGAEALFLSENFTDMFTLDIDPNP